ncbi:MAG: DUF4271 domain-containing protein [Flavobacteriales bacterium]|nr:DUF4271 domain-containing protein [Flavobacteriales bacterium]
MDGTMRAVNPMAAEWATGVFLSCLLILATVNIGSPRKWRVLRQAAFRMRMARQILRDEVDTGDRNVIGLLAVATASLSMLIWQSAVHRAAGDAPSYLSVFMAVALALLAQAVILRLCAFLFRADGGITEYLYTGTLLYSAMGIAVLPLVVLTAYWPEWRPWLFPIGLALLALSLLYRWVRGAWIGLGEGVPLRYILLYLCGAEILPLCLLFAALRHGIPPALQS